MSNIDLNKDGINEEIDVNISFALEAKKVKSVVVVQSLKYAISETVQAEFKLPLFNIFQAPSGFAHMEAQGLITLDQ